MILETFSNLNNFLIPCLKASWPRFGRSMQEICLLQILVKFWISCPSAGWLRVPPLAGKVSVGIYFDSGFVTLGKTGESTRSAWYSHCKELKQWGLCHLLRWLKRSTGYSHCEHNEFPFPAIIIVMPEIQHFSDTQWGKNNSCSSWIALYTVTCSRLLTKLLLHGDSVLQS